MKLQSQPAIKVQFIFQNATQVGFNSYIMT